MQRETCWNVRNLQSSTTASAGTNYSFFKVCFFLPFLTTSVGEFWVSRRRFNNKFSNNKTFAPLFRLRFVFTSWPAFFINAYSYHTCPRLEATTVAKGSGWDEWESFIAQSSPPHFLISSLAYSPPLLTSSPSSLSLYALPTLRPPCRAKAMRPSIHAWLTLPGLIERPHRRTCLFALFLGSNTHRRSVRFA